MYSILRCFEERKWEEKTRQQSCVSPVTDPNQVWEDPMDFLQSSIRFGNPYCMYNDAIIGHIELSIKRSNNAPIRHSTLSAVSNFVFRPAN